MVASFQQLINGTNCTSPCTLPHTFWLIALVTKAILCDSPPRPAAQEQAHVCHCSQNEQLGLCQNQCMIHSLSMGGAHSRVEAYVASPTSPPYFCIQLTALFHTQPPGPLTSLVYSNPAPTNKLHILVKAQPSTPST